LIKEYLLNRSIDKHPTHHSGVSAHIIDATMGADLEGTTLAVNGKSTTSKIDGIAEIIKVKPATYNVSVSLAGYAPQSMKTTIVSDISGTTWVSSTDPQSMKTIIVRGKVTELEIKLAK
jgi:hypothetical protein